MNRFTQQLIKFNYDQNFKDEDFYVSRSNREVFEFLNEWLNGKNFLNIVGKIIQVNPIW